MTTQPSPKLYTVLLTELGAYRLTVAADDSDQAERIAKRALFERDRLPDGMHIVTREADAVAEPEHNPPIRQFRVAATYKVDFELTVPAATPSEASVHAKRLYDLNCGPFEFDMLDERVSAFTAEEVVS